MLYFTIVRHGETICNVEEIVQSRTHGQLTEKGILMVNALGQRLADESFSHIYSSDLGRCRQTTQLIVSNLRRKVPKIEYTSILRERDYGDWEMQSTYVVRDRRIEMGLPLYLVHHVLPPNGESLQDCKKRAGNFFSEILKLLDEDNEGDIENENKNVLAVSHGHFIICLIEYLIDYPDRFQLVHFNQDDLKKKGLNTCLTRFSISKIQFPSPSKDNDGPKFQINFSHFFDAEHLKNVGQL